MLDDAELLRRYLEDRSEEAFAELVRRHLNLVYFAALRRVNGDAHRAEDVTQCVFAKLVTKAPSLVRRPSLAGWFYLTARFEAAHAVRTEQRRQARELEAQAMHDLLSEPEPPTDWIRLRSVIDEILCSLNARERELILLRFFQGNKFEEIGSRLGLTADAARLRLDRTLEKMRAGLAKRGVSSTAAALALALAGQATAAAPAGLAATVIGGALASAGKVGTGAAGLLQFMSTSKLMVGSAVMVGLLAIGLSSYEMTASRKAEAALAATNREYELAQAQLQELRTQARREDRALADLLSAASSSNQGTLPQQGRAGAAAARANAGAAARTTSPGNGHPVVNHDLSNNPDMRAALAGWMNGANNVLYGPLFKALGLTAAQIESLDNLILERNINMPPATGYLTLRPDDVSPAQVEQSISALLGNADYQQFTQYESTVYVRDVTSGLAGNLYDTGTPLTAQQADQLTQILGESSSLPPNSGPPFPGTINWDAALAKAQGILSAPQYAVFQNVATVLSSQPGLWAGLSPIGPGSIGNTARPPPAVLAASASTP